MPAAGLRLASLPAELIARGIAWRCNNVRDLRALAATSRSLHSILTADDALWAHVLVRDCITTDRLLRTAPLGVLQRMHKLISDEVRDAGLRDVGARILGTHVP